VILIIEGLLRQPYSADQVSQFVLKGFLIYWAISFAKLGKYFLTQGRRILISKLLLDIRWQRRKPGPYPTCIKIILENITEIVREEYLLEHLRLLTHELGKTLTGGRELCSSHATNPTKGLP
jgi:hypothetical protein